MLQLEHVSKNYGSIRAVDDLNFAIKDRQVVGLLGMNGAGKSTTLNMITGCTAPSSGNILINGHNIIDDHRDAKREFGYLPEIVPLYDEMTVEEYLRFVCELKEIVSKYISKHICDICETVGIRDIMKRPVINLSKGLRQRVGIAQALCGNPPVIILDEPTIGLDPVQTISFRRMIRTLSQEHT
ncbi:MAG: ABC transporter, partial [Clostridiales bacterium]|nr:ABC transporter [Clostridiales bacterium]